MAMSYKIGTTFATLTALDSLTVPLSVPNFEWQDYESEIKLGNKSTRGIGLPVARWIFSLADDGAAQRNQLKAFCAGKSAAVFIATQNNGGTFANFSAIMHWPLKETKENNWDMNLTIEFTDLVAAS